MKTFVFGAGASVPFFNPILSTQYLTKQVNSKTAWENVIAKYKQNNGKNHILIDIDTIISLIKEINNIFPNANFEQIAEVLDKICSYGFDNVPTHNMNNLVISIFVRVLCGKCIKPFGCEWADVPFLFREIIAEAILDLQNNGKTPLYDKLLKLQSQMIQYVCDKDPYVNIVSLNYDDCIIDSIGGLGFEKGFSLTNEHYLRQLDIKKFMEAKKVVYFPHGQLKFQFTDNDNVTFWSDSNKANEERWARIDGVTLGSTVTVLPGKFAYNYNTFISTGQTKDDGLNHLPYAIYYQRLAIDLAQSDTIYVVGYSFGDDHINRLLRSFIKLNPMNKIVVVDFYPYKVYNTQENRDPNNIITKIYHYLGADWTVSYSEDTGITAYNEQDVNDINTKGYGKLCPQVIFYKKGYEEFLKEYNLVI